MNDKIDFTLLEMYIEDLNKIKELKNKIEIEHISFSLFNLADRNADIILSFKNKDRMTEDEKMLNNLALGYLNGWIKNKNEQVKRTLIDLGVDLGGIKL